MRSRSHWGRIAATTLETLAWVGLATALVALLESDRHGGRPRQHLPDRRSGRRDPARPGRRARRGRARRPHPQLLLHQAAPPADDRATRTTWWRWGAAARGARGRAARRAESRERAAEAERRAEQAAAREPRRRCSPRPRRRAARRPCRDRRPAISSSLEAAGRGRASPGAPAPRRRPGRVRRRCGCPPRTGSVWLYAGELVGLDRGRPQPDRHAARPSDRCRRRAGAGGRAGRRGGGGTAGGCGQDRDPSRGLPRPALAADRHPHRGGGPAGGGNRRRGSGRADRRDRGGGGSPHPADRRTSWTSPGSRPAPSIRAPTGAICST